MNLQQLTKSSLSLMLLLCLATFGFAQDKEATGYRAVSGTIRDAEGNPVEGVTVSVKGRTGSVLTDIKGNYTIPANTGQTLVFTHIAYNTKELAVTAEGSINVSLEKSNISMDDVIVVGYGAQKKGHLTGAVESIKAAEVEHLPVGNLGAALAGRVLGLAVSGGTSRPGSRATLTVRNPVTFSKDGGTTDALYVIDGVVQVTPDGKNDGTQFNNLDPSEVETITVLKDASAAIYGSRAANGVILVTTKRGKAGVPKFNYNGSYGINDETYRTKMLSAYDFGRYMNIMNGPNGANALTTNKDAFFSQDELDHFKTIDHDWLDPVWKSSYNMRHTLSVSGGTERATFFANASYYEQDGNLASLKYKKWTFRAGTDINLAAGLKAGLQLSGNWAELVKTFNKIGGENDENDYRNLLLAPRYIPTYVDGYAVKTPGTDQLSQYHFYEIEKLGNLAKNREKFLAINMYAEYAVPVIKGLKARFNYARYFNGNNGTQVGTRYQLYDFNFKGTNGHIYEGATPKLPGTTYKNGDRLYYSNTEGETQQINFNLNYDRRFGLHNISAVASVERGEAYMQQADVWKEAPVLTTNGQFGSAFGALDGKTAASESGTLGYIARVNYAYNDKYLAEFTFRTDASTHFAPENYWGRFYSASAGWVISNESFFNVNTVNFLKLRYSAGLLGKDDTKAWQWRQRYTYQNGKGAVFGGNNNTTTGMKMEASPNRDAHWSNDFKNNLGIDARFLNNRLSATLEGFYNKNTEMLIERTATVPLTVGGTIAAENWGKMDLYGYEIGLGWRDNVGKDFSYNVNVLFTWYDNKWKQGNFAATDAFYPWKKQNGASDDNGIWGYEYLGMFKNQADIDAYVSKYNIKSVSIDKDNSVNAANFKPGMLYYADIRGQLQADGTFAGPDGIIDENDQIQIAKKASNHYGLATNIGANYKGFGLDIVITGSFGGFAEIDGNARKKMNNNISRNFQSRPAIWSNIYDPELNPNGTLPNPNWESVSLAPISTFWEVSAFRLGIRNANLNYALPKKITNAMRINSCRINLSILNPINFFNPYDYKAPDGAYDVFPVLKTYSIGVSLGL